MKRNSLVFILLGLLVIVFIIFLIKRESEIVIETPVENTQATTTDEQNNAGRAMSIEQYVTQNISELSSEKEVLGGTFYVTKIEANEGKGTVYYEDGHNAFVADFTYETEPEHGAITIKSFVVRK